MGIIKKIKKVIRKYLCCGKKKESEIQQIYDEISQTDNYI